jgi:hypothetical protein
MKTYSEIIKSLEDFLKIVDPLVNGNSYLYRGQKKLFNEKGLLPRIGRYMETHNRRTKIEGPRIEEIVMSEENFLTHEKDLYKVFDLRTKHLIGFQNINSYVRLALAQHHGLSTRLLDWTLNPLVALFFAVEESSNDGKFYDSPVIYRLKHNGFNRNVEEDPDPLQIKEIKILASYGITPRIVAQQSVFTVHPEPWKPFDSDELEIIRIDPKIRKNLKKMLFVYGINRETLFPDLDGATSAFNYWKFEIAIEE